MGSNGIVTETAHLSIDKDKFNEGYDRIFKAKCAICGEIDKKSRMNKTELSNGELTWTHRECELKESGE